MNKPFLKMSIVIPVHGRVDLFEETIQYALNQSCDNYEIVVSDDSSLEKEREQIRDVIKKYDKKQIVRYVFTKENLLQAPNTNQGLKAAKGEYVRILHSDDAISPNCIRREIELLECYPEIRVVYHDLLMFSDMIDFDEHSRKHRMKIKETWLNERIFTCTALPSAICLRKNLLTNIGVLDEKYQFLCDWDFFFRILINEYVANRNIIVIPHGYIGWRVHNDSTTGTMALTHFNEHLELTHRMVDVYDKLRILPEKELKAGVKLAEDYRYRRVLEDYNKYKNFKRPRIPLKYIFRYAHEYNKYLGKAVKSFRRFIWPLIAFAKWITSPFAFVYNILKFVFKK
jgi:glycosyltransferase involved in cell wall biosynthesis